MPDKETQREHDIADSLPRFISAHEVALEAGVSRSAVSRTFTPGASVSPATREKVLKAAEKLGYQVNDLARGLLANRSRIVGMIAADPDSPFRSRQIARVRRCASVLLEESARLPSFASVRGLCMTRCQRQVFSRTSTIFGPRLPATCSQ